MDIEVTRAVLDALYEMSEAAHPNEACGILLGEGAHITAAIPTRNVHRHPETHFEIDPQALIDAHRKEREGGPAIMGYYHSHPTGDARPSATDRAMAAGDGKLWVIVAGSTVTLWRDLPEAFAALSYRVIDR
ncbi:Mov34/MPN/PAD-1 family protein [Erythrobacter aurantius]|uniref:Mov34/MPN/PAD-1 family protein n=1 Tax=Erythrobacter aurantius TaxID=2909249 RepID=UPI00207A0640|nr:M67 family metallopeptidase [Erythrobacter aurantius]